VISTSELPFKLVNKVDGRWFQDTL
jgi:hypothetical protein